MSGSSSHKQTASTAETLPRMDQLTLHTGVSKMRTPYFSRADVCLYLQRVLHDYNVKRNNIELWAMEKNPLLREILRCHIVQFLAAQLVFFDETLSVKEIADPMERRTARQ
eukprot:gene8476-9342_t